MDKLLEYEIWLKWTHAFSRNHRVNNAGLSAPSFIAVRAVGLTWKLLAQTKKIQQKYIMPYIIRKVIEQAIIISNLAEIDARVQLLSASKKNSALFVIMNALNETDPCLK